MDKHYDIGIFGLWFGCNYGSIATYYALNQTLKNLGKSVLMIDKPRAKEADVEHDTTHSRRFALEHYDISPCYTKGDFYKLNDLCDGFVIGSDQVWNYGISSHAGYLYYLDFAGDDKLKIAYAASLGHSVDFAPENERAVISRYLARFDGISVRESSGVDLLRECYGINSVQVLDPVFLADHKVWDDLIAKSDKKDLANEKYLVTYILDPTEEKRNAILHIAKQLGNLKVINILDGLPWLFNKNRELMNLPNCVENVQVEDWLFFIKNSEFVVTDSCHGLSFALIFKRPFVSFVNTRRGYTRFASLSRLLGFEDRLVSDADRIYKEKKLLTSIDYEAAGRIFETERKKSLNWLSNVLNSKRNSEPVIGDSVNTGSISLLKNAAPSYDRKFWRQTISPDGKFVRYIPVNEKSKSGHIIFFKLQKFLIQGEKYHAHISLRVKSKASQVSVYLVNPEQNNQLIHKITSFSQGETIEIEKDFTVKEDGVSCLAFGASQITGPERFLELERVDIVPFSNEATLDSHSDTEILASEAAPFVVQYKFNADVWDTVKLEDNEILQPKLKVSKPRNFAYVKLPASVRSYPSCAIKFQCYLRSDAPFVNIHLANSKTGKLVIVHKLIPDNTGLWQDLTIDYINNNDRYDSIMVGAMQISGDDRAFGIRNVEVVKTEKKKIASDSSANSVFRRNTVLNVARDHRCTGCGACAHLCPKNAITMAENSEGFLVPHIDTAKCIDCGICLKKCISEHPVYKNSENPECLAVMADDDTRKVSSSGGVFSLLANYVLQNNGYVCGAAYKDDFSVQHIIINDIKDLPLLRGSKYIQSNTGDVYRKIKELLNQKSLVLFTGLPCQVAGLYAFLGKNYDNLYAVDLLCHGITSFKVFNKYHQDVLEGKPLERLEFRSKAPRGWSAGVDASFQDGTSYSKFWKKDSFFRAYVKSISVNYPCGTCVFNHLPRQGDLSIGDYWGISRIDPEMNDKKGTSVVLINNPKGQQLFDSIRDQTLKCNNEDLSQTVRMNIIRSPYRLHKNRDLFFENFDKYNFRTLVHGCRKGTIAQNGALPDSLRSEDAEFYYLAKHTASMAGQRAIVSLGVSEEFEGILKKYFGLEVSYHATLDPAKADNDRFFLLSSLKGKVKEVFLVSLSRYYKAEVFSELRSYGYRALQDYIFRIHRPVVLKDFDLSKSRYSDAYGNTIEGDSGIILSVVFHGCNSHIRISGKVAKLDNLSIELNSNSNVTIGEKTKFMGAVSIQTVGASGSAEVTIGKHCRLTDALIRVYNHESFVRIGDECTFESDLEIRVNSGKTVAIGKDCMFSHGIDILAGDGHSIFDVNTAKNVNSDNASLPDYKNRILIGDHVWVGKDAFIMHGTEIGSGSIIGARSVVKGRYPNNCAVAGNPAKCVRNDVAWSRNMFASDMKTECGDDGYAVQTNVADYK